MDENAEREHSSAHNLTAVDVQLPRTLSQCSGNHSVSISVKKGKEYVTVIIAARHTFPLSSLGDGFPVNKVCDTIFGQIMGRHGHTGSGTLHLNSRQSRMVPRRRTTYVHVVFIALI